jgi:hypothetical protein
VPADTRTIDFPCPNCDAAVKVDIALAGKQTPCPECRRIIKVPLPKKEEPKDWRKAGESKLPLGARREDLAMQDPLAATAIGKVSAEALLEAGAVPEAREPTDWRRWLRRGVAVAAILCVLGGAVILWRSYTTSREEGNALEKALGSLGAQKGNPSRAAELHRATAEFYLLKGQAPEADQYANEARKYLLSSDPSSQRDVQLIDLAQTEADLIGSPEEARKGTRLKKEKVHDQHLKKTLGAVRSPEARLEALRSVGRQLMGRGDGPMAVQLARELSSGDDELLEATAQVGLAMLSAKDVDGANAQADFAQKRYDEAAAAAGKDNKSRRPPPAGLIALRLALNQPSKAAALGSDPSKAERPSPETLEGYVEGLARKGQLTEAQALLSKAENAPLPRLRATIALAAGAVESDRSFAARFIQESAPQAAADAAQLANRKEYAAWLLMRLVRLGVQAGVGKGALQPLLDAAGDLDPALRGRMQLEVLRGQLRNSKDKADDELAREVDKETLAHALALESLARHNARHATMSLKTIDGWNPESLRPFGYIGVALGLADRDK